MTMQFKTIVASIEDPKIPHEVREALKLVEAGGRVHVLHALPPEAGLVEAALPVARDGLRAVATPYPSQASLSLHVRQGDRAEETLRLAVECGADLVVLGAFRPEAASVVPRVMSWAACSVLVLSHNHARAESDGFVPLFPQCGQCEGVRQRHPDRWYCEQHQRKGQHAFEVLEPPASAR